MKLLSDQGMPAPLRGRLPAHSVDTLAEKGWSDKDNGESLNVAEREGYEVLVTTDQRLPYQQNLEGRRIGLVVLLSTDWREVRLRTREIGEALRQCGPARSLKCPLGRSDMATDTSERSLETADLHGAGRASLRFAGRGHRGRSACGLRRRGLEWRELSRLRPRVLCRSGAARRLLAWHPAGGRRGAGAVRRRADAACVPDPAAGRDRQARLHRRAAHNGIKHGALHLDLFYGTPSAHNPQARERFEQNRFTVTRQLRYSPDDAQRALDIGLFINGLPVFTFELKNSLTKQTVDDAVLQYQQDRNPREKLFEFGRCIAHFAVDEREVQFCTRLAGKASWFLPFNRGWNDGAGNPPNPDGLAIDGPEVLRSLCPMAAKYGTV